MQDCWSHIVKELDAETTYTCCVTARLERRLGELLTPSVLNRAFSLLVEKVSNKHSAITDAEDYITQYEMFTGKRDFLVGAKWITIEVIKPELVQQVHEVFLGTRTGEIATHSAKDAIQIDHLKFVYGMESRSAQLVSELGCSTSGDAIKFLVNCIKSSLPAHGKFTAFSIIHRKVCACSIDNGTAIVNGKTIDLDSFAHKFVTMGFSVDFVTHACRIGTTRDMIENQMLSTLTLSKEDIDFVVGVHRPLLPGVSLLSISDILDVVYPA